MTRDERGDPVGRWFVAMEPWEGRIDIRFCGVRGGQEDWYDVPHSRLDGIGALIRLARQRGERAERLDPPSPRPPPSSLGRARRVARQVLRRPAPSCPLRGYRREASGERQRAALWWTAEETAAAHAAAKREGTSANARLLRAFDAAIAPLYAGDAPAVWLMPVNMRDYVEVTGEEGNYIALVNVPIPRGATARDVHAGLRIRLKDQEHWAIWDLWRLLPDRAVGRAVAKEYSRGTMRRAGMFSNLGRWEGDADRWIVQPVVSRPAPLGAVVLEWNGRLSIAAAAHPAAGVDAATLARWLDQARETCLAG